MNEGGIQGNKRWKGHYCVVCEGSLVPQHTGLGTVLNSDEETDCSFISCSNFHRLSVWNMEAP